MSSSFYWGAGNHAHQIEGGNVHSDVAEWENLKGDSFSMAKADHYRRWPEDIALLQKLGLNAHRLSLEWSRLQPQAGVWDEAAFTYYENLLLGLKRAGIEPFVTLYTGTNPLWFSRKGGWQQPGAANIFTLHVDKVMARLGHLVTYWITIDEPETYIATSKQQASLWRTLTRVHNQAYSRIHRFLQGAQVSVARRLHWIVPSDNWLEEKVANTLRQRQQTMLKRMSGQQDFTAVNYTGAFKPKLWLLPPGIQEIPEGLEDRQIMGLAEALTDVAQSNLPVVVTGKSSHVLSADNHTLGISAYLRSIEAAQTQGVNVGAFFYWPLFDHEAGMSWSRSGTGLIGIDKETGERIVRPAARAYSAVIQKATA